MEAPAGASRSEADERVACLLLGGASRRLAVQDLYDGVELIPVNGTFSSASIGSPVEEQLFVAPISTEEVSPRDRLEASASLIDLLPEWRIRKRQPRGAVAVSPMGKVCQLLRPFILLTFQPSVMLQWTFRTSERPTWTRVISLLMPLAQSTTEDRSIVLSQRCGRFSGEGDGSFT